MPFEKVSTVACPFLSLKNNVPVVVGIMEEFKKGRPRPSVDGKAAMEPGMVARVQLFAQGSTELEEAVEYEMGFPAIAHMNIEQLFPKGKYVGQLFRIIKHEKTGGGKATPCTVEHVKASKK